MPETASPGSTHQCNLLDNVWIKLSRNEYPNQPWEKQLLR